MTMRRFPRLAFLRLFALQSLFNPRGAQRAGWVYACAAGASKETLARLLEGIPGSLNVTPPLSGLMVGAWRKQASSAGEGGAPIVSLTAALSARGDRFVWNAGRPALFTVGVLLAILAGPGAALAAPIVWTVSLVYASSWGLTRGSAWTSSELVSFLKSPPWSAGERAFSRVHRTSLGVLLGLWLAGGPDGGGVWMTAPLAGAVLPIAFPARPMVRTAAAFAIALALTYLSR
jgi:hypothetical protein